MLINYSEKIKQFNKKLVEKFDLHLHKMFADKLASSRPYPIKKFDAYLHKTFNIDYPNQNTHEYVDLGLPSGTLWATMNIGATSPEEYGDYFAWGETSPKESYTEDNYTYSDNPEELPTSADAAYVNWGKNWRTPSKEQVEELINSEYTSISFIGIRGVEITSKSNNNSIYIPLLVNRYLTRTLNNSTSEYVFMFSPLSPQNILTLNRYLGTAIRPVKAQ